jgi:hypothetical protein
VTVDRAAFFNEPGDLPMVSTWLSVASLITPWFAACPEASPAVDAPAGARSRPS